MPLDSGGQAALPDPDAVVERIDAFVPAPSQAAMMLARKLSVGDAKCFQG
ncbi:hypothetical protein [Burkholderia stabilis]|nr:hypothetical protein [Burkholderia stabilis]